MCEINLISVSVVIEDTFEYPRLVDVSVRRVGLWSIATSGKVIGTLFIGNNDLHTSSSEDIQLLTAIGEGLGPALKAATLYRVLEEKTCQVVVQQQELLKRTR